MARSARVAITSLLAVALVAMALVGFTFATAQPAEAALGIGDGCTGVPDEVPGFYDYTSSCDTHDQCYADDPYGEGEEGRARCDREFHRDLQTDCAAVHGGGVDRDRCEAVADLYYWGVRTFGDLPKRIAEDPDTVEDVVTSVLSLLFSR